MKISTPVTTSRLCFLFFLHDTRRIIPSSSSRLRRSSGGGSQRRKRDLRPIPRRTRFRVSLNFSRGSFESRNIRKCQDGYWETDSTRATPDDSIRETRRSPVYASLDPVDRSSDRTRGRIASPVDSAARCIDIVSQ